MHLNPRIAALLEGMNHPSLPGIDLSLTRMEQLLAALGNPERRVPPVIHLAGTNGKGSVLAFLRAIYQAAGYSVHAYTSPHLVQFNERIVLNGHEIADDVLEPLLARVSALARDIPVTFFEATTAAAFLAFAEHPADVLLLETGLGGRLDATNVVPAPAMTVITPIGFDHMEFLGGTMETIAAEKAGIIKPGVPCIVGAQTEAVQKVLARAAYAKRAPLLVQGVGWDFGVQGEAMHVAQGLESWKLPMPSLPGAHQYHNAALASVVAKNCAVLPVTDDALQAGVAHAVWPGRLQRLTHGPLVEAWGARGAVYLDGGHNGHAAQALAAWMGTQSQPITLIAGMMARKNAVAFFKPLAPHVARVIAVPIPCNDCYAPEALAAIAQSVGAASVAAAEMENIRAALEKSPAGTLLIAGSLFLVGEVLKNHS